jgi:hypothetical protein
LAIKYGTLNLPAVGKWIWAFHSITDQSFGGISGSAGGFTGSVSRYIRRNINLFGDYNDYRWLIIGKLGEP